MLRENPRMDAPARTLSTTRAAMLLPRPRLVAALRSPAARRSPRRHPGAAPRRRLRHHRGEVLRATTSATPRQDYRGFSDELHFAVDLDFPQALLPEDVGLIVSDGWEAAHIREAPAHPLAPARRKALMHRFATLAATRLAG